MSAPKQYADHPLADIFPLLASKELAKLAEDVNIRGLENPIWRFEGKILDGRNRYRACLAAYVEPVFRDYEGNDPLGFVLSQNLHRRHLNESQRALVAAKIANLPHGGAQYRAANLPVDSVTQAEAADKLNVSERSVRTAKKVLERADERTKQAIEKGQISVSKAAASLQTPKSAKSEPSDKVAAALDRIESICGKQVRKAIEQRTLKIADAELVRWAAQNDEQMARVQALVVEQRLTVTRSLAFLNRMPGEKTKVAELIVHAAANEGATLVMVGAFATYCLNTKLHGEAHARIKRLLEL